MITNTNSGTAIDEVAAGVYRISTPVPPHVIPGGFSFNQYLIIGDAPVIFHTGPRGMFPLVREAIENVIPVADLKYIGLSHFESDECGALNEFLALAPEAVPLCSRTAAMISINDIAARPARALADGEVLSTGGHELEWVDAPHLPHNWETGYLFDRTTKTLFCGDLFTQGGTGERVLTDSDILGPSEAFRRATKLMMPDYFSGTPGARAIFERLAATSPHTLACMHGSVWSGGNGNGASALLMQLADSIGA